MNPEELYMGYTLQNSPNKNQKYFMHITYKTQKQNQSYRILCLLYLLKFSVHNKKIVHILTFTDLILVSQSTMQIINNDTHVIICRFSIKQDT